MSDVRLLFPTLLNNNVYICTLKMFHKMLCGSLYALRLTVQATPENELRRANITCLVYSHDGSGMPHYICIHVHVHVPVCIFIGSPFLIIFFGS